MDHSVNGVYPLSGIWQAVTEDGTVSTMRLPGSLDENNIGLPEEETGEAATEQGRYPYSRKCSFRGPIRISRSIPFEEAPEKRYFIDVERSRALKLFIDDEEVLPEEPGTLVSPYAFEVTGRLSGAHMLTFVPDNSFPGMPAEELAASNMASNATATNWNGLLGEIRIREEDPVFIESLRVRTTLQTASVTAVINAPYSFEGEVVFSSRAFEGPVTVPVNAPSGRREVTAEEIPLATDVTRFEEGAGKTYELKAQFEDSVRRIRFGVRTFTAGKTGFFLNGRPVFLRGENSEALHPETAHPPMRKEVWSSIFKQYAAYGVNFVRFASHCPPEAAFEAADEFGMLVMPELSHEAGRTEALGDGAKDYYRAELKGILKTFAHHPSFVCLGLPFGEKEESFLTELSAVVRETEPGLLCAAAENSELSVGDFDIRNFLPVLYEPDRPLLFTGIGPFGMLPDFREIDLFSGVLEPKRLLEFQEKIREKGRAALWEKYVEMSGETALIRYREAIEKALTEPAISGILLKGLQDVPGKRERPCGMLNSHLVPKQYAFSSPERFRTFFGEIALLVRLKRHCFLYHEELEEAVYVVNHSKTEIQGPLSYVLTDGDRTESGTFADLSIAPGTVFSAGRLRIGLAAFQGEERSGKKCVLRLRMAGAEAVYPVFLFPETVPICPDSVYETAVLDLKALEILKSGGNVFLTPELPSASYVNQVIEKDHPIFKAFQSGAYTDERWEALSDRRGFVLPDRIKPIVSVLPDDEDGSFQAELFEARVFSGAVLVSALGLKNKLDRPEAVTLLAGIYDYMASYDFSPTREITVRELTDIVNSAK